MPDVDAPRTPMMRGEDGGLGVDRAAAVILAGVVIISHGIHLLNASAFWDGTIFAFTHETRDYAALFQIRLQQGSPPTYFVHRWLGLFPWPMPAYRIAFLAAVFTSSVMFYQILRLGLRIPRAVALLMATLAIVLPFAPAAFEISLIHVHIHIVAFLAGVRLLIGLASSERPSPLKRVLALVLLAESTIYGTFMLLAVLASALDLVLAVIGPLRVRQAARRRVRRLPDVHALPFVCAVLKNTVMKPYGLYAGYNTFQPLTGEQIERLTAMPLQYGGALVDAVASTGGRPGARLLASAAVAMLILAVASRRFPAWKAALAEAEAWPIRRAVATGLLGIAGIYLTVGPFFLVGRRFISLEGYESRDNMVPLFAVALSLGALLFLGGRGAWIRLALGVTLAVKLMTVQATTATAWLKEDVIVRLIPAALRAEPRIRDAQVIVYEDRTTSFNHLEWREFAHLLRMAFGDQTRIGLPPFELSRCESIERCVGKLLEEQGGLWRFVNGLRDARGCGNAVKVELDRSDAPTWWKDYLVLARGGADVTLRARNRIRISVQPLAPIACAATGPTRTSASNRRSSAAH